MRISATRVLALVGGISFIVVPLVCGAFVGAGTYTAIYANATSYLSSDPKACANCHIMRDVYDGWQKASHHANAVCVDCHLPHDFVGKWLAKIKSGYNHSKGFTLQDFHEPIRVTAESRRILETNCIHCHENTVHEITMIQYKDNNLGCTHCHQNVGHGPTR